MTAFDPKQTRLLSTQSGHDREIAANMVQLHSDCLRQHRRVAENHETEASDNAGKLFCQAVLR